MTTIVKFLAGALFAGVMGAAQALPITDTYTPASPVTLTTGVAYSYSHSLLPHGFDPLVDILSSVTLSLDISGPDGQSLSIIFDAGSPLNGALSTFLSGPLSVQLAYLQNDGVLDVTLTKGGGGGSTFTFTGSTLFAQGTTTDAGEPSNLEQVASVPEPGMLALLGLGLLGGILVRRRAS